MIRIRNVKNLDGTVSDYTFECEQERDIDAHSRLLLLPGMVAPHVAFETPASPFPLAWGEGAQIAIRSGFTTVLGIPKNVPCITKDQLLAKMKDIDLQLQKAAIPLNYKLFLEAEKHHLNEMGIAKEFIAGIKVALGSSTSEKVIHEPAVLDRLFQIAGMENVLISVNLVNDPLHPSDAILNDAAKKAIEHAIKYSNQLLINRIETKEQIQAVRAAQEGENLIYASTAPALLLHSPHKEALFEAIRNETIDLLACESHELLSFLPTLFKAYHAKNIKLEEILNCTVINPSNIFNLERSNDAILVDYDSGKVAYTILKGILY